MRRRKQHRASATITVADKPDKEVSLRGFLDAVGIKISLPEIGPP